MIICVILSSSSKEGDRVVGASNYLNWITFFRTSSDKNNYLKVILIYVFLFEKIFLIIKTFVVFLFSIMATFTSCLMSILMLTNPL